MADSSFDIVSRVNKQELNNAVDQSRREIATRYDFKGSKCAIEFEKDDLTLIADDNNKMQQLIDVVQSKLIKRGISLKTVHFSEPEAAASMTVRSKGSLIAGISQENAKKIHKLIKDSRLKVKSQSMDESVRVSAKSRDDLQSVQKLLNAADLEIPLQYVNYK